MNDGAGALNLLRLTVALFIVLSLILTFVAISVGVPYRVGGIGEIENVGADSFLRGTGLSAPIVFLIAFAVLLALTWLPTPWRAVPVFMIVVAAVVIIIAGTAEIPLGSGPFAYDIGLLAVIIWALSMASAVAMIVVGLIAGFQSVRRATAGGG